MPAERLFTPRFAGLWCYAFVTFFSAFQLLPAIPLRILQLGGSKAAAGWFLAVYTFASALSAPLTGTLADTIGRKRLLIAASLLFVLFSLAYGAITWLPLLLVVGAIHGTLWSGILTSSSAIITEFIPLSRRTEGLAYWGLASNAAIAVAPAIGLWIEHFGWWILCGELAVLSLVMALGAWMLPVQHDVAMASRDHFRDAFDWKVILTTCTLASVSFGYGGVTSYVAIVATERHIEPRSLYFTLFALSVLLIRVFTSRLGDRFGPRRLLYPSLAAIPIAFAILAVAHDRVLFAISAVLFGSGFGAAYPAFVTLILGSTDVTRRARTFGSILWAFDTGIGTGSIVIGALAQHFGFTTAFCFAATMSCLAIPIFLTTSRHLARGIGVASDLSHAES